MTARAAPFPSSVTPGDSIDDAGITRPCWGHKLRDCPEDVDRLESATAAGMRYSSGRNRQALQPVTVLT